MFKSSLSNIMVFSHFQETDKLYSQLTPTNAVIDPVPACMPQNTHFAHHLFNWVRSGRQPRTLSWLQLYWSVYLKRKILNTIISSAKEKQPAILPCSANSCPHIFLSIFNPSITDSWAVSWEISFPFSFFRSSTWTAFCLSSSITVSSSSVWHYMNKHWEKTVRSFKTIFKISNQY